MPECIRIIPRAKLTRIARLDESLPGWNDHLRLLSAEGCLCIMHEETDAPDEYYLVLFDYPDRFRSFNGDLTVTDTEIRLITKDTGYVFTVTDSEMNAEKENELRRQAEQMLTLIEAENALSAYLGNDDNEKNSWYTAEE
ncbi:MAG: hypothetical protein IKP42_06355 [Ruminococcus sp.]|nr:hypothetical protein [Ruminococcus sp.]